jgi:hypothetical protein
LKTGNKMAISIEEIEMLLDKLELKYHRRETDLLIPFHADSFINAQGENTVLVVVQLSEVNADGQGEYIKFFSPMAFQITNPATKAATLESLAILSWKILMIDFEYDHNDGEIRPTIDFPIEDGTISLTQLRRCLMTLPHVLEDFCAPIYHAIETGEVHESLLESDLASVSQQPGKNDDPEQGDLRSNLEELRSLLEQFTESSEDESATENIDSDEKEDDDEDENDDEDKDNRKGDDPDEPPKDAPNFDWI